MSKASTQEALDIKVFPVTVHLSTAQIADLHNTGVAVVPAPGVGKMLLAFGLGGKMNAGANPFSGYNSLRLGYGADFDENNPLFKADAVLSQATDKEFVGSSVAGFVGSLENQPLTLRLGAPANADDVGAIDTFTVADGGTGYVPTEEVAVLQNGSNDDATIIVDTVGGGGQILTAHLGSAGSGYAVQNATIDYPVGGGDPGTIEITAIDPAPEGDGDLDVTVLYAEIPV